MFGVVGHQRKIVRERGGGDQDVEVADELTGLTEMTADGRGGSRNEWVKVQPGVKKR